MSPQPCNEITARQRAAADAESDGLPIDALGSSGHSSTHKDAEEECRDEESGCEQSCLTIYRISDKRDDGGDGEQHDQDDRERGEPVEGPHN